MLSLFLMVISSLASKIKSFSKTLPEAPGIYMMKGSLGEVLYIGKAKNIKNRVLQYFQKSSSTVQSPRIELLIQKMTDVEAVITDTEVEALVLECNFIKKYKPRFNVQLKDDKSYPYVRLDMNHPFPRLEYVRRVKKTDGARYFGPYVSASQIQEVLAWAQKTFKLRDCSDNEFRNRSRPCILHQMGRCSAPCVGYIEEAPYHQNIEKVLKILDGKTQEVLKDLKSQMQKLSDEQQYEKAATLRDQIRHIEGIHTEQKITDPESALNRDVVHFARQGELAVSVVLNVREGKTIGVFSYPFHNVDPVMSDPEFLFQFLAQYYLRRHEEAPQLLPDEVLIPEIMKPLQDQISILSSALGRRHEFYIPKRGIAVDFIAMVKKTAQYHLDRLTSQEVDTLNDLIDVQKRLGLKRFPHCIECYDISHFQGQGTVASRAVFIDGKPEKGLYRHYHVRGVEGPDDYKSLREILERRFSGDQDGLPNLVVIDGGRGQLAIAQAIFSELSIIGVELVAIAKAKTKPSFKEPEVRASLERIFKPHQKNPIGLKPGTGVYRIMTQIRDESHRFAITFHRQTREKKIFGKKS